MKKWSLFVALIWPHIASAAPEAPFLPLPNAPDYVATIFVKLSHGSTFKEVRTFHDGWMRVDGNFDQRAYRSTSYFGPGGLFITFAREPTAQSEGHDWLHVMRGPATAHLIRWGDNPFKTGERQTLLGEDCEVWNLSKALARPDARRLSCVTPDGIELWSRIENDILPGTSFETTAIMRKPVAPDEVRPPADRLDLESWLTTPKGVPAPSNSPGDVTVIMQSRIKANQDWQVQTRTIRRHYPWTYTEDVDGKGGRKITFNNEVDRLGIVFQSNATGDPVQLSITKALRAFVDQKLPDSGRTETILGETCIVSEEHFREGNSNQCRTADGVMLKDATSDHGAMYDLVAVKLDRAPVDLDAVLPPPRLFMRATWGILD
jgi:hypothetical protein